MCLEFKNPKKPTRNVEKITEIPKWLSILNIQAP